MDRTQKGKVAWQRRSLGIPALLFIVTVGMGFFLVRFLEQVGMRYLHAQTGDVLEAMSSGIENNLRSCRNAARAMAGSPWIFPALVDPTAENLKHANSVLDRYNESLGFSICYLLDAEGNTIASSNRSAPDSFRGQNYAFRPYFREAIQGRPSIYMAVGATSKERGFYAAHPVRDSAGKILGVAAIKEGIDASRNILAGFENSFLVSPEGLVFMSGNREFILRPLWPMDPQKLLELKESRQFQIRSLDPVLAASAKDGERIRFRGKFFQLFQKPLGPSGWSLVLFAPLQNVFQFIFLGWIITAFAGAIILVLTAWTFFYIRTQETLRRSEEKYRGLFEHSRDAVMIIQSPSWKFVSGNPATLRMFRAQSESEFISKEPWSLSPERQPDGRNSAEKAREMIEKTVREGSCFFEWTHKRFDGEEFPVTVLLSRIEKDPAIVILATVRDVTREKQTEETLKAKLEELARFNRIAVGRELRMIELKKKIESLEKGKVQ